MPKLYLGFDLNVATGLGTTNTGGGGIQAFDEVSDVTTSNASASTTTALDFSNGITYNTNTDQWIGAVNGSAFYVYDSLEAVSSNTFSQRIAYGGNFNYNNGITHKADTDTYVVAYYAGNTLFVEEYPSLQDAANRTGIISTKTATGLSYNNGIEYNAETGEWYGAYNAGASTGVLATFGSLDDMLAYRPKSEVRYQSGNTDFDMGLAFIPCFTRGTLIETKDGSVAVEDLAVGDMVVTLDHGHQPVRWIGSRVLTAEELDQNPNLRPIRISAGALAPHIPASDLVVSPQHRVLIRSKIAQRMFGTEEVLVAAKHLLELAGVEIVADDASAEYFHILFETHQVVFSNGAPTESLYTGEQALRGVGPAAREEIFQLFPELATQDDVTDPVRQLIAGRAGRKLVSRHLKNDQDLIAV